MKKIPQAVEQPSPTQAPVVLPGTESTRSLGEILRQAEQLLPDETAHCEPVQSARPSAPRRARRLNRAQSRRHARERALQALYQWDVGKGQSSDVRRQFLDGQDMSRVDVPYFTLLFNGVSHHPDPVDAALSTSLDRDLLGLDPVERAVLRLATFELMECQDIPARVIINEAIEVTKRFGADNGHRYVNGVLDKVAAVVRPLEMRRR